jgi:hypothetical protein
MALRVAILRRHGFVEHVRFDRLGDPRSHRFLDASNVDGEQQIGGAVGAFSLDPLLKPGARGDHVDLDAGVLGESIEQRLDQSALAIRINVDLARLGKRWRCERDQRRRGKCGAGERAQTGRSH